MEIHNGAIFDRFLFLTSELAVKFATYKIQRNYTILKIY
jgi:hypothetical protein